MGGNGSPRPQTTLSQIGMGGLGVSDKIEPDVPRLLGLPLKYISLITLALQNASLGIVMHYSRISTPPSRSYSAATAVLLNEFLKGTISLCVAFRRLENPDGRAGESRGHSFPFLCMKLASEIFSPDCWKLSIPAILYVIQNNLQFVAASNLEAATFQVSYQMKILTTAAFSVLLLRKRINLSKWFALLALAIGVAIVQIQSGSDKPDTATGDHIMHPFSGFMAVTAACFTSGLAGVYFEMVLKGSQTDLWIRNVQLSFFSLLPALMAVFASSESSGSGAPLWESMFANFGFWAWATVAIQVFGGLVTAIVIKYSDNILKGFATSLSIVFSFLASVALFDFHITASFVIGSSTVLAATWLYNRPESKEPLAMADIPKVITGIMTPRQKHSYPGSPIEADAPILGEEKVETFSAAASPRLLAAALKLVSPRPSQENLAGHNETLSFSEGGYSPFTSTTSSSSLGIHTPYYSRSQSPACTPQLSQGPSRKHSSSQLEVPSFRTQGHTLDVKGL